MGDGSLVLLPTPGHTPGSMSLLVRRSSGAPLLMVGDVTYEVELLEAGRIPGVGDQTVLRTTSTMIRELERTLDVGGPHAHRKRPASQSRRG